MPKTSLNTYSDKLNVLFRFFLTFVIGYVCTAFLCMSLTQVFQTFLANAEAIYLAAFISIFFYLSFIIVGFCFTSLSKLALTSFALTIFLFGLSAGLN